MSSALFARIAKASAERGWNVPWYPSAGTSFSSDCGVTIDPENPRYNYRDAPSLAEATEMPGYSAFLRDGDSVPTRPTRGHRIHRNDYTLLDLTAFGRQDAGEEPKGRSDAFRAFSS